VAADGNFPSEVREAAGLKYLESVKTAYQLSNIATDRNMPLAVREAAGIKLSQK
jgi:hypothetical protein